MVYNKRNMHRSLIVAAGAPILIITALALIYTIIKITNVDVSASLSFALLIGPIWLPLVLFYLAYERWMRYVEQKYVVEQGRTTLRIKLPQEVFKSPEAMEAILNQTYTPATRSNLMEAYLDGKHPLIVSLEMVSIGGEIRFYVNTPTSKVKDVVEAQFYAQYPGVEIVEEPVDYAAEIKWDPEKMDLMSFRLGKKEEDDVLPIKTYIDMGLDKLPKEEEKLDPISPLIELLASIKPHERWWVQILIRPHAKRSFTTGSLTKKETWEKAAQKKIEEIMQREKGKNADDDDNPEMVRLTPGERDRIEAIERNSSKWAFETIVRGMYITLDKDRFNGDLIGQFLRYWAQFDVIGRNKMGFLWRTDFDYNFINDPTGRKRKRYKEWELRDYKRRYYYPYDVKWWADEPKVMSI